MEKFSKLLNSKIFLAIVAIILTAIISLQESSIGTAALNMVCFSAIFGLVCGSFVEGVRKLIFQLEKFDWLNVVTWIVAAVVTSIVVFWIC